MRSLEVASPNLATAIISKKLKYMEIDIEKLQAIKIEKDEFLVVTIPERTDILKRENSIRQTKEFLQGFFDENDLEVPFLVVTRSIQFEKYKSIMTAENKKKELNKNPVPSKPKISARTKII